MHIEIIMTIDGFPIYADIEETQFDSFQLTSSSKSKTITTLEAALQRLGNNELLQLKLKHLPIDFTYTETASDAQVLKQALVKRYED